MSRTKVLLLVFQDSRRMVDMEATQMKTALAVIVLALLSAVGASAQESTNHVRGSIPSEHKAYVSVNKKVAISVEVVDTQNLTQSGYVRGVDAGSAAGNIARAIHGGRNTLTDSANIRRVGK